MIDKVVMYAQLLLECVAFAFVLRYDLHMFQLNGYKNNEYASWMRKNTRRSALQGLLYLGLALGVVEIACGVLRRVFEDRGQLLLWALDAVIFVWEVLVIVTFCRKVAQPAKKKFVYTARVKRLIVTDVVLALLVETVVLALTRNRHLYIGVCLLFAASQFWMILLVNLINRPLEQAINRRYINDAKRMLREMPDLTVIGVTGSYGKTSVKFYLQALLRSRFDVLVTPESYNTPMGVVKTIRGSLKPTHEIFVCEMGARYVGDIKELCDIVHPDHGIITAVGPQHLETFGDIDHVRSTKFELAEALPKGGILFLNADNDEILKELDRYGDAVLYHTCEMDVGYRAKEIRVSNLGTEFTVETDDGESERFAMPLIGEHNVINVMGAIAVAHKLGMKLSELKVPVRQLAPVRHRMEMIERGSVTIIDDAYNSNPIGSRAAVETLAMFEGLRILITPGMVELGAQEAFYNKQFGAYAAPCCDYILLVGRSRTEPIREGASEAGFAMERCLSFDKVEDAMAYAYGIADVRHKYILLENDLPDQY